MLVNLYATYLPLCAVEYYVYNSDQDGVVWHLIQYSKPNSIVSIVCSKKIIQLLAQDID